MTKMSAVGPHQTFESERMTKQNPLPVPSAAVTGDEDGRAAEKKVGTQPSANSPVTPPAAKKKSRKKSALTLEEFIEYAYSRHGQRLKLTVQDASNISSSIREGDVILNRLQPCVDSDVSLRVPRELLMTAETVSEIPRAREAIRAFVLAVMLQHPLYQGDRISPALQSEPSLASIKQVLSVISPNQSGGAAGVQVDVAHEPKIDAMTRKNAYRLLFTWFATSHVASLDDLTGLLFETLWEPIMVASGRDRNEWVRALVETEDIEVLGWMFSRARDRVHDARRSQSAASQQAATSVIALEDLKRAYSLLSGKSAQLDTEKIELQQALEKSAADFARREQEADLRYGSEVQTLTGRLIALLENNAAMLQVGITAASRSEGNLPVLLERAESVAVALSEELTALRSRNIDATT